MGKKVNDLHDLVEVCKQGGAVGAGGGVAAAIASSGGLDAEVTVPLGAAIGCISLVDYQVILDRSAD